jgi:hypothetical protein
MCDHPPPITPDNQELTVFRNSSSHILKFKENKFEIVFDVSHVKWVHCHHGMACPQVTDRGDGLQI